MNRNDQVKNAAKLLAEHFGGKKEEPSKGIVSQYNFQIKKGLFGKSLFDGDKFICIIIEEQLPLFHALVDGYNYKLKNENK